MKAGQSGRDEYDMCLEKEITFWKDTYRASSQVMNPSGFFIVYPFGRSGFIPRSLRKPIILTEREK